jgi:outer membrane protein assembly factor BamB
LGGAIVAKPVIVAKKLYLGAFDRTFYEIDRATGAVQALFDATGWFWGGATSDGTRIYVPNLDGNIYAWHIADGRLAWVSPGDGSSDSILATPVVFGDGSPYSPYMLAYASDSGVMVVVRARDGQREWDRRVGDEVRSPLTIDGRLVFLHSLDETVSAIDIETKQLAWARDLDDIR